jgi:hypothetical protein
MAELGFRPGNFQWPIAHSSVVAVPGVGSGLAVVDDQAVAFQTHAFDDDAGQFQETGVASNRPRGDRLGVRINYDRLPAARQNAAEARVGGSPCEIR